MKRYIILVLLLVATTLGGCRKDSPDVVHPTENSYTLHSENYWSNIFDDYWNAMNQGYLFWEHDTIDWDAIYGEYAPQFAACDSICVNDPDSYFAYDNAQVDSYGEPMFDGDALAGSLFYEITTQLLDHHYVFCLFDIDLYLSGSAEVDIPNRDYYHKYNNEDDILAGFKSGLLNVVDYEQNVSGRITNLKYGEYFIEEGQRSLYLLSYLIDGSIPYLYISQFYLSLGILYDDDDDADTYLQPLNEGGAAKDEVLDNFEYLVRNTPNMNGAILDVRANTGGYNDDLKLILGRFVNENERIQFGYTKHKSGPNRYDYTQLTPAYILGISEEQTFRFPLITLVDIRSISMAEITAMVSRTFSENRGAVIGERTYGATCGLTSDRYYAGGVVSTDNFEIYTSSGLLYDLDMNFYEGVGITPDVEVLFEESDWGTTTTDKQKEVAIEYIKGLAEN